MPACLKKARDGPCGGLTHLRGEVGEGARAKKKRKKAKQIKKKKKDALHGWMDDEQEGTLAHGIGCRRGETKDSHLRMINKASRLTCK